VALEIVSKIFFHTESRIDCNLISNVSFLFVRMSFSIAFSTVQDTISNKMRDEQVSISNFVIEAYFKEFSLH
jgi:hypothetical protein